MQRLANDKAGQENWRQWGPYLSERQWGTVREDYSPNGTAWDYLPHDHARSRAYRWGEDGIAGFSDDRQHLCLSLAMWNGQDPILKERLFGLTNSEGNHGEDVKEFEDTFARCRREADEAMPINLSTMKDPELMKKLNAAIPLGRMARPEEIASMVTFLAGDGASYMTATTIFADGGIMQSSPGL
jgi:hypothetical protein